MRIERCRCGGVIAAPPADDDAIFIAVYRHVRTERHEAWFARREVKA